MFYGKFADEGNNPNIYNVEGDNKLSAGLQPLTPESVFNSSVIVYFILENILLSTTIKF
jgi:hypothetical protein